MRPNRTRVCLAMPVASETASRANVPKWLDMGYEVVLLQDRFRFTVPGVNVPGVSQIVTPFGDQYIGWPRAVNYLVRHVIDPRVGIVVAAGDDMEPDPVRRAEHLAAEFWLRFPDGFGVMQPTGDPMDGTTRICGSPWMGRGWLDRAYCGMGAMWGGYFQFYADEELKNVAERLGVLWQRPDVTQYHHHWTRENRPAPGHHALSQERWDADKAHFLWRQAAGFPASGSLPPLVG